MSRETGYEIDMCSGAIRPKLLRFAMPLMGSSILQLLFNAADIIVVGRFAGDNSMAAVGSTSSLINLLVNLFIGLSVGANVLAARYCGAGDREGLRQTVHTAIMLSLLSGAGLAVLGACSAGTMLTWMRSPGEVRGLGYAALPMLVSLLGACALRLVWVATVFQIPEYHTVQTVYWSYPFTWSITGLAHFLCFLWAMRHLRRHL